MHPLINYTTSRFGISTERLIRESYEYAEHPLTRQAVMKGLKWCHITDKITPEIEDYCYELILKGD